MSVERYTTWDSNCPINEQTGDGQTCGRCWFYLPDGKTCPRHGDVSIAIEYYKKTNRCMLEFEHKKERAAS